MGAKVQPSKNPHRVNVLGRFDAKALKVIAPRADFDYGYETRYAFQNITSDGTKLYGTFYAVKGAPQIAVFDRAMNADIFKDFMTRPVKDSPCRVFLMPPPPPPPPVAK